MRRLTKVELLEGIEDVEFSKLIAYNTIKYKKINDNRIYIRFHDTDIIIFHSYYIVLNSGRYRTKTAKNRMNKFQNICQISQVNYQWYVNTGRRTVPFYDYIRIGEYGAIL